MTTTLKFENIRANEVGKAGAFRVNPEQAGWKNPQSTGVLNFFLRDLVCPPEGCEDSLGQFSIKFQTTSRVFTFSQFSKSEYQKCQNGLGPRLEDLHGWAKGCAWREVETAGTGVNWGDLSCRLDDGGRARVRAEKVYRAKLADPNTAEAKQIRSDKEARQGGGGAAPGLFTQVHYRETEFCFQNERGEKVLDFPTADVVEVTNPSKNELHVELAEDEDLLKTGAEQVSGIRFWLPNTGQLSQQAAESLKTEISALNGLDLQGGDAIAEIPETKWLIPVGKYSARLLANSLTLRGKSSDFTVRYQAIAKIYVLTSLREISLVLQLNTPIRQGQQQHSFLCLQLDTHLPTPTTFEINYVKEDKLAEAKLQPHERALLPLYETVGRLLRLLTPATTILPYDKFQSSAGKSFITCTYKNNDGLLYPLKKGILFLAKPVLYISYTKLSGVEVQRGTDLSAATRFFDLNVVGQEVYEFRQVLKEDLKPLMAVFKER